MTRRLSPRDAMIARYVALGVAGVLLLVAALGLSLVMWVRPSIVSEFAGVTVTPSGGVRVVGRQMSPRAVGDRTIFALATDEGTAAASALPTGFPLPAVGEVVRSAVYRDSSVVYRSAVVSAPVSVGELRDAFQRALAEDGWTVEGFATDGSTVASAAPIVAGKGDQTARIEFAGASSGASAESSASLVGSPAAASTAGILISSP